MDYYRSPQLTGPNFDRVSRAAVRGNLRRSIVAGVAEFSALVTGKTLEIYIEAGLYTVTFTGNTMALILSDINTALGGDGLAYDDGGCIAIQSSTIGYPSRVAVTGGTAASYLGFDLLSQSYVSASGDVAGVPEGQGLGIPFGTMFPGKGDNLTRAALTRPLSALASNMDVLYSDLVTEHPRLTQITGSLTDGTDFFTVNAGQRIFTGYDILQNVSTPEDLAPFFAVHDANGRLSHVRVIAVVKGTPLGHAPPYADTASYGADDGGNVLGLSLLKVNAQAITAIPNGRVIRCSGATFTTDVLVGDIADIQAAANSNPWSNDGARWIVETVIDNENLALRPMTAAELTFYGTGVADSQPIISLNTTVGGGFGTVSIRTGTWCDKVTFILSACIAAPFTIWACTPSSVRGASAQADVSNGNGMVAVAESAGARASSDVAASNWQDRTATATDVHASVRGAENWISVGAYLRYSVDGQKWNTPSVIGVGVSTLLGVAFNPAEPRLTAVGSGGKWAKSNDDGVSWVSYAALNGGLDLRAVAFDARGPTGAKWMTVGVSRDAWASDDGVTWVDKSPPGTTEPLNGVAFDGTNWVVVGEEAGGAHSFIKTSSDGGVTWSANQVTGLPAFHALSVAVHNRRIFVGLEDGYIYSSDDVGVTWTLRNHSAGYSVFSLASNATHIVAVMTGGLVKVSNDNGVTWRTVTQVYDGTKDLSTVSADPRTGQFLAAGYGGIVSLSLKNRP